MCNKNKIKILINKNCNENTIKRMVLFKNYFFKILVFLVYPYARFIKTPFNLLRNKKKIHRQLEIGPGPMRISNFETINIVWGLNVDYIGDVSKKLPFESNSFDIIYASHVLEHMPWFQLSSVIKEWVRILKPGGSIELWVPNGLLIAKTFVDAEYEVANNINKDGWYKFNEMHDPCLWANGRIFSYGDGTGRKTDPNWHMTIFSPRYLQLLLTNSGLINITEMSRSEVRGHDHGWINFGLRGFKP